MNFSFIPLRHDLDSPGSPLGLDLLGLQVHLDQVTLEIDAQTGAGKYLR